VSFFLESHYGGAGTRPATTQLRALLAELSGKLDRTGLLPTDREALLDPIRGLLADEEMSRGHQDGFVLFRSPDAFFQFRLPWELKRAVYLEGRFHLIPLIERLSRPQECYVLALSRKNVRLLRCGPRGSQEVTVPDMPLSLDEFAALDQPDHLLANASGAGPGRAPVSFTTGTDRERQRAHFHDFCRAIQLVVTPLLRAARTPLVVAATDDERARYHEVAYPDLLVEPGLSLSPDAGITDQEIAAVAMNQLRAWLPPVLRRSLAQYNSLAGSRRGPDELHSILRAAAQGRVHELFLVEGTRQVGDFDAMAGRIRWPGQFHSAGDDLVNAAAVETLRHHGEICVVPAEQWSHTSSVAAVLRY
jgi:hypothetical protein